MAEENGEPTEEMKKTFEADKATWEDVKEDPFLTVKKEYVVCLDTLS